VTLPGGGDVTSNVTENVTSDATLSKGQKNKEEALPIKKAESFFQPTGQGLGASSGEIVASGRAPAPVASPGLEGRSLPAPPTESQKQLAEALRKSKGNGHGKPAEPNAEPERGGADPEPLPEPQRAEPAEPPAVGLFGALEAAIRAAKNGDE
jgi:hypothetical protein